MALASASKLKLTFMEKIKKLMLRTSGLALEMVQKGGIKNLRTLARAYTDVLVRARQGRLATEGSKQKATEVSFADSKALTLSET